MDIVRKELLLQQHDGQSVWPSSVIASFNHTLEPCGLAHNSCVSLRIDLRQVRPPGRGPRVLLMGVARPLLSWATGSTAVAGSPTLNLDLSPTRLPLRGGHRDF